MNNIIKLVAFALLFLIGCSSSVKKIEILEPKVSNISFSYLEDSFIVIPVQINDQTPQNFILDTGIGVNLISKTLCQQINCKPIDHHTGKRMSGQKITIPVFIADSVKIGEHTEKNLPVGIFDIEALMPNSNIAGFLSLSFFKKLAVTVDYKTKMLVFETANSLDAIKKQGAVVPVQMQQKNYETSIHMPIVLPNDLMIAAEVDTGSQALILHEKYMKTLKINPKNIRHKKNKDETGHFYHRYFTKLPGPVHLPNKPDMKIDGIDVMFQKIIYEGLIGHYFLKEFKVTFNLPNTELIFQK